MATEIKLPKMGIDMVDGAIARWLKGEGDSVKAEEPIAEVETDKSTVEMAAPTDGVLLKIVVPEDQIVPVGTVVAYIGQAGESVPSGGNGAAAPAAAAEETPAGEAGEARDALKQQKRSTADSAPTAAPPTRAAPAPQQPARPSAEVKASPVAKRLADEEGIDLSTVQGTGPGGRITKEDVERALVEMMEREPAPPDGVRASPAARRLARDHGYNIAEIPGTGPGGRIVARDVMDFEPTRAPAAAPAQEEAAPATAAAPTAPAVQGIGSAEEVPLSRMRKRITQVLTASKGPVPHFYVTMDVDMEAAMALRKQMNETLTAEGVKVSVNDLVVKAVALALRKFPNLNSSFAGDKIVKHGDINVGVAVSTESGLLTVATRNTDRMALSEVSETVRARAGRAREGKVQPDDLGGTTFTVSNLGMYGVDSFVAIITPPEAAILAVGGVQQVPVVKNGQIVIGQRMKATISADHRVTDGAEAAEYMVEFKRLLENPMRLML